MIIRALAAGVDRLSPPNTGCDQLTKTLMGEREKMTSKLQRIARS